MLSRVFAMIAAVLCRAPRTNSEPDSSPKEFVALDELNDHLPCWIRFGGELRERMEAVTGNGFRRGSDATRLLSRLRINMTVRPTDWLNFHFQGQDSRVFGQVQRPLAPPFQGPALRVAYVEAGDSEKKMFGLRIGRQELLLGDQRLVGNTNSQNVPRVFDAVRLTMRRNGYRIDSFASNVVQPVNGEFDRPFRHKANNFHGIYGGVEKVVPNAVVEPYVFWRVTRSLLREFSQPGNRDFKTIGVRWSGRLTSNTDYQMEMTGRRGTLGTDGISAWAGHWLLGYPLWPASHKTRLIAEYNFASGDRNPHDGVKGTFDQLYPSTQGLYGLADQVGRRNIHDV